MNPSYDNFVKLAITEKPKNPAGFLKLKKEISKKLSLPLPTNADLYETYEKLMIDKKIKRDENFERALFSRHIRTQSGVAVVAVLTKSYPCPGKCLYCPNELNMPKSYLSNEPAVMRAIASHFNPYQQVQNRLRSLKLNGHKTDKIELIVMGGTFSCLPKHYQKWFITECFRAANDYPSNILLLTKKRAGMRLKKEQSRNEKTKYRIIGLTLETRPDYINEKEIINFRILGCTRVELGVQSIFDDVLKKNKRGHSIARTVEATKLLKDAGFKISYHIMPGLLGSSIKKDYEMFEKIFFDQNYQPDMLKIYPTIVEKSSELYKLWKNKKYRALTDKDFEKFILKVKNKLIPPYVRISRLIRDVPAPSISAGPIISNLRQMLVGKSKCPCIRCREVRMDYNIREKIILDRIDYDASGGKEIFLQFVSEDKKKLFALLRLRIPSQIMDNACRKRLYAFQNQDRKFAVPAIFKTLQNAALIREVHTYGKMTEIGKINKKSPQHEGLGKKLIAEAEKIAREEFGLYPHTKKNIERARGKNCNNFSGGVKKIVVISGVGVRQYYRKLGYRLKDTYMVKNV